MIDGVTSGIVRTTSGFPQGSVLGPVLFMLYVNNFPRCVPTLQTFMYTDDTKLTKEMNCVDDCLDLQQGLSCLCD